uniref:BZIP domain-containing protein n=1 Tax=Haptolina brevifila TaxID=156173 RepID=A0A7S2NA14_9EUKA|mmetsp:Transcript_7150/g.14606  ORF Transcript_7150/g.14606 Transcript_7150/m.14606 type:complete len:741 (+) Transcript_7150:63-2285(+)
MQSTENASPIMWSETEKEMSSTADISQLLDLLPDPSAGSTTVMSENCLADLPITFPLPGIETNESSSGSGTSSPQYAGDASDDRSSERTSQTKLHDVDIAVEDLDMWDMLLAIDGPQGAPTGNPSVSTPETPAAFERQTACVSPNAWAAAAECLQVNPQTPLKPQVPSKGGIAKPKAEKAKAAGKAGAKSPRAASSSAPLPAADSVLKAKPNPLPPVGTERPRGSDSGEDTVDLLGSIGDIAADDTFGDAAADEGSGESAEDKRLKRMRRNRESAAMSRNRKKQYVEELEAQVASLNERVTMLQTENFDLRRECARARGPMSASSPPPPLPLPSPPALVGSSTLALRPPLPEPPLPDLALLEDLVEPEPTRASQKRAGSPLLGGGAKRASAASIALMSAVTFITFSVGGHTSSSDLVAPSHAHAPGARMLMSLDDLGAQSLPSRFGSLFGNTEHVPSVVDDTMLWPSLKLEQPSATYSDSTTMLPLPRDLGSAPPSTKPAQAPRGYAERVIRAPQNSSWADVLRIEAAEKQMAEAQMALRALGVRPREHLHGEPADLHRSADADAKALAAPRAQGAFQMHDTVLDDPSWKSEEPSFYDPFETSAADAERYIFCSRAYMFDAIHRPTAVSRRQGDVGTNDFDLPSSMPERFRYTADRASHQELPQLTDGDNASSPPGASDPSLRLPVVNLLLPMATLQGVRGVSDTSTADEESGGAGRATGNGRNELMQVQCQVLNASRWS